MKFSSGKIIMELASGAGVVVLEHEDFTGRGNGLEIDVPPDWSPTLDQFTLWCCRFLGMVMDDKPLFTNVSDPMATNAEAAEFVVTLKGPIDAIPLGTVLAPVPEASA